MPFAAHPLNVAILAVPAVTAWTLFGMVDLFSTVGRDWSLLLSGVEGAQLINPYIVAVREAGFAAANGIWVRPHYGLGEMPTPDIVCVPDFSAMPGEPLHGRFAPEVAWLRSCYEVGATITSACSGALLLAEAGLLAGCDATIHWAFAADLARYPNVKVRTNQSLVVTGIGERIVMAGGGTSWLDMALYLIARYIGLKEARQVARIHMLDWHDDGQLPFASLLVARQIDDALIVRCQEWIALNYAIAAPVAAMMRIVGLPERSFMRRFTIATGMSPLEYVHRLRIEEAKQMLETADAPVEVVAAEVGYQDASFFGRLFRRRVGMTPAHYRRRFSSLRRALAK
jgi:transcriptional regulator GlxA family with amidase domain